MTSLFHTYILTLRQQISEPDLFRINLNFETICNSGVFFCVEEGEGKVGCRAAKLIDSYQPAQSMKADMG